MLRHDGERHGAVKKLSLTIIASLLILNLASQAKAATTMVGSPVITSLDPAGYCPGSLVQISMTVQNLTTNGEEGRVNIALSTAAFGSCWTTLPNSINSNVWHFAKLGGGLGTVGAPLIGSNDNNSPNGGYRAFTIAGPITATLVFTIQLPPGLVYGQGYRFHIATKDYYLGVGQPADSTFCQAITACTPSGASSFVGKRVEGTAANGQIMLYWLDYDFINSTNNKVQDLIPACASIVSAQPNPYDGTPATIAGQLVTWRVADATSASTPTAYRESGALWVLVSLGACPGTDICNTGQFTSSFYGGAWQDTNEVCQPLNGPNVTILKRQYDATYAPVSTVNTGATVNYVLQYTLSGSGLQCFDSFNSYAVGTYNANAIPGGLWGKDPDSNNGDQWSIKSLPSGEKYIQYQNNQANYRILRYDCANAKTNTEDICGNKMIEVDVRIDGNAANGDTGIVIRNNGRTTGSSTRGYMVILSVDSQGAGNVQNLQLQKNLDPFNAGTAWPAGGGYTAPAATAPRQGVWYTIKALENPAGTFRIKYWERGTPEPGWQITYTDPNMIPDLLGCGNAGTAAGTGVGDGWVWRPGIAGQNDLMSYDNFRVYSSTALTNAFIWDTVPLGIDYVSASPLPVVASSGHIPDNSNNPATDYIKWSFTNSNHGATGNTLYEGSGSFTWTGTADCVESPTALNIAHINADLPATVQDSNETSLTINGCNTTPTNTPSRTATPTDTQTRTSTSTPTPTSTYSATPSATPTRTSTATPTSTSTYTATPSVTPSRTSTATPSATPSFTPTATVTFSRTQTSTATDTVTMGPSATPSPTFTATNTFTATPTFSATVTQSFTSTHTPTRTNTPSNTPSVTETSQYTSTDTPTITATPTFSETRTATPTFSATPTHTQTVTQSDTFTFTDTPSDTPTFTETPTDTQTATPSPTRTVTLTFTNSPTHSPTPVPVPHHVTIGAYNSAGELVKLIFDGGAQYAPGDLKLDADTIAGGAGGVNIAFPGYLYDPTQGATVGGVLWMADNNGGQTVSGGVYYIKATITDNFGQVTTLQHSVQVVSVVPENSLRIYNSAGEVVAEIALTATAGTTGRFSSMSLPSDQFAASFDPKTGGSTNGAFEVQMTDSKGNQVSYWWNGLTSQGIPAKSGSYVAELVYNAGTSGSRVVESKSFIVLQAGNIATLDGAFAYPNPVTQGGDILVGYPVSINYPAVARLYNLAGEMIAQSTDPAQKGVLRFPGGSLASGVYVLKVEKLSGAAVVVRTTLKVAVVH